jgi:hypothetical protein
MLKRGRRRCNATQPSQRQYAFPTQRISPHIIFFLFYNLLYLTPLLLAFAFGYEQGGVANVLDLRGSTVRTICYIYAAGVVSFISGSTVLPFLTWSQRGHFARPRNFQPFSIGIAESVAIALLIMVFIASKIALIPLGVYHSYAFDTGNMKGGVWSFSTFCSEAMILAALLALFSKSKRGFWVFVFISAINGINLLHGTRIFFISSVMAFFLYAYIRGKITLKVALLYGPIFATVILFLTYLIFLSRSSISASGAFSAAKLVSPLVYESVFSQMSLIAVIKYHLQATGLAHAWWFPHDLIYFTLPRFIVPDKDASLFIGKFDWVSPLGAFSGYSQGLLYFGAFFPAFYFFWGLVGSWLYRKAQTNSWWFILYALFTEDFLLHLMRDGYIISSKMLINALELVFILIVWRAVIATCSSPSLIKAGKTEPLSEL